MWWLLKGPTGHWDLTARADKTISKSLHPNARLRSMGGEGEVVGFKGVATTRPSPSWWPFPKNTLSLILTLNINNNIIIIIIVIIIIVKFPYISVTFFKEEKKILISQPKIKIMTRNFQDMILGVYTVHQECHGWPIVRTPVCTPDISNAYISAKNEDNATKLSGYDPWCLHSTSRISWMTHCAYPCLYPCLYPWFFRCLYFSQK